MAFVLFSVVVSGFIVMKHKRVYRAAVELDGE